MYRYILVPLDGSALAECVLPHVNTLVRGCGVSSIIFMRVVEPVVIPAGDAGYGLTGDDMVKIENEGYEEAKGYLARIAESGDFGASKVEQEVVKGRAAESIIDYTEKNSPDLIVMATHGRSGVSRWIWGSVADRVLRSSRVPVLVVRSPGCGLAAESDQETA